MTNEKEAEQSKLSQHRLDYKTAVRLIEQLDDDSRKNILKQIGALFAEKNLTFAIDRASGLEGLLSRPEKKGEGILLTYLSIADTEGIDCSALSNEAVGALITGAVKRALNKEAPPLVITLTPGRSWSGTNGIGAQIGYHQLEEHVPHTYEKVNRYDRVIIELGPEQRVELTESQLRAAITGYLKIQENPAGSIARLLKESAKGTGIRPRP